MGGVDTAPEMERMTDMRVYADQAATTSLSKTALEAMLPWMTENFGNPSALHEEGRTARDAVETAREKIAYLLHAKAKEIYFTSGGTEADNWALQMAAAAGARIGKKHIIVSAIEHHAVLNPAKSLERQGFRVTYLPVTSKGLVLPKVLEAALCPDTALVSVMYANNEVGTIQPVEDLAAICRMHGVWFHTDAVQAAGHVGIDLTKLQADFLSVSAHKFHGPKGCGFLYVRNGFQTESLLEGGAQEKGKRAGTENVPGIVGMAAALEESLTDRDKKDTFVLELRRQVAERLLSIEGSHLNGCEVMEGGEGAAAGGCESAADTDAAVRPARAGAAVLCADRLCGNLNISFDGIEAEALLLYLDMKGVSVSAGAACSAGALEPSHVLTAMGISPELAKGTIRISLDETNTQADAEFLMEILPDAVARLRSMA